MGIFNFKGKIRSFMHDHAEEIGNVVKEFLDIDIDINENAVFTFRCLFAEVVICEYSQDLKPILKALIK